MTLRALHLIDTYGPGTGRRENDIDAVATLRRATRGGADHFVAIGGGAAEARRAADLGLRCDAVIRLRADGGVERAGRAARALAQTGIDGARFDVVHAWSARLAIGARAAWPGARVVVGAPSPRPIDARRLRGAARGAARERLGLENEETAVGLLPAWRGDADAARFGLAVGMAAFALPERAFVALIPSEAKWLERAVVFSRTAERLWRFVVHDEPAWVVAAAVDAAACVYAPLHAQRQEPRCEEVALAWSVASGMTVVSETRDAIVGCLGDEDATDAVRLSAERETLSIGRALVETLMRPEESAAARKAASAAVIAARDPGAWARRVMGMYAEAMDKGAGVAVRRQAAAAQSSS